MGLRLELAMPEPGATGSIEAGIVRQSTQGSAALTACSLMDGTFGLLAGRLREERYIQARA